MKRLNLNVRKIRALEEETKQALTPEQYALHCQAEKKGIISKQEYKARCANA